MNFFFYSQVFVNVYDITYHVLFTPCTHRTFTIIKHMQTSYILALKAPSTYPGHIPIANVPHHMPSRTVGSML